MPGSSPSSSGSVSRSRPSPPGNSVEATSAKCSLTAANVSSKRRSTVSASSARSCSSSFEARLEVGSLLGAARSGAPSRASYSSLASGLTCPSVSRRRSSRSSFAASSSRSSPSAGSAPASSSRRRASSRLGLEARELDVDPAGALAGLRGDAPQLGLLAAEPAQLRAELAGARGARVDPRAQRRLEARGRARRPLQDGRQTLAAARPAGRSARAAPRRAAPRRGARARRPPRPARGGARRARAAPPPRSRRRTRARRGRRRSNDLRA